MDRGDWDGQSGRESKTYSRCQEKRGSNRHHRQSGVRLMVTQGIIVLEERENCSLAPIQPSLTRAQAAWPSLSLETAKL